MKELVAAPGCARVASRALYSLILALPLLSACGSRERAPPPYEANPSPKEAYEVVVTTHDAPEDMFLSDAAVGYIVANSDCLPPIDNFEGVSYGIEKHLVRISLRRISPNQYVGKYFRDAIAEKNYFGRGVCSWKVQYVSASLMTHSTESFTYFPISTTPKTRSATRYSRKEISPLLDDGGIYPDSALSETRFEATIPESNRSDFFSYNISIVTRNDEE